MRMSILILAGILAAPAAAAENLIVGGDFEQAAGGWNRFWSRSGEGEAAVEPAPGGSGSVLKVKHPGKEDWSFQQARPLDVKPGEIYELKGRLRVEGSGTVTLCVTLYGAEKKVLDWSFGGGTARAAEGWQPVSSRLLIPPDGTAILPRLIGDGPATVWADDLVLVRSGSLDELRAKGLPKSVEAKNDALEITFDTQTAAFSVADRRDGTRWSQRPSEGMAVLAAASRPGGMQIELLDPRAMRKLAVEVQLLESAEFAVAVKGEGKMDSALAYPSPFETAPGQFLILPVNEGISYPVDDESLPEMSYHLYGGHGLCMGWYGVTDTRRALLTIVETPDDAAVRLPRVEGRLALAPQWQPQKGSFGPERRVRYCLFGSGGYVAMCKRYRSYAKQVGLLKTLAQKRQENPEVDKLVGAVNVWAFGPRGPQMCEEMQAAGIERILWSNRSKPDEIERMNARGVLTSRYDIYQDCMNPANFDKLRGIHPDWTSEAWPNDVMIDAEGDWVRGWNVKGKDGQWYPCAVLCDRLAPDYARRRIAEELKTHAYRCRFIDTTTASPWRECYHKDHPLTRSESKHWKMELLRVVSEEFKLVTGSETGHEASVPYVHYFEGMLSLGPYRVPDSGRDMLEAWDEVPERVAKFQTGHKYRLPLWELVYHDCVVAQWYWGDYNNKLPALWDRRNLINALYGTPPMFMFDSKIWEKNRDRFVQSYRSIAPVARAAGYSEMLSHEWLMPDHAVQRTRFDNGVTVTVNFGDAPFTLADGTALGPLGQKVTGVR